jgi:outer membrane protein assembly factor BamB
MNRVTLIALALLALLSPGCSRGTERSRPEPFATPSSSTLPDGLEWEWLAPPGASTGMPAADDRDVAFTHGHQYLVVLDETGRERWQSARLGLRDVAPRLTADLILAATDDGLAAFRRTDGSKVWDTSLAGRASTPVVAGGLDVTSTWEGDLIGIDMADGAVVWKLRLSGGAIAPPAGDGTTVVAVWQRDDHRAAGATAVEARTGRTRWAVPLEPGGVGGATATPDGAVVLVAGDLAAHALALTDGRERWRTELAGAGSPEVPPAVVDDHTVLVANRLGGLDLLDLATGRRQWHTEPDGAAVRGGPVVGPDGTVAFPLDDGRLLITGPHRETEVLQAPGRISGVAHGPGGVLVAATRGAAVNAVGATRAW